ncbi:MAG: CoA-binding protein [bacterium]
MDQVCELPLENADSEEIRDILQRFRSVAVIGVSGNNEKASHQVARYLKEHGYTIYPVNPRYPSILGRDCYPSLLEIPDPIEVVDIFRRPSAVPDIVEDAISRGARVIWMQQGIVNNEAAQRARDAGLRVVMDRCMMSEHKRLAKEGKVQGY